ncbi:MAG: hypothetical protein ABSE48_05880 [Verrucomicrobiota bacterium]|jgi:uncharacterized protein YbjQ (UPF0145 family)
MKNFAFTVLILTAGCTTSSNKVTGITQSAVSPEAVKVYDTMPDHSKIIGTVSVTSFSGLTLQHAQDAALQELKTEAGMMGANGVVLTNTDHSDDCEPAGAKADGNAIFVERAKSN